MKLGDPSLDQLRIFLAVAEEGSFGAAARKMGRAVSAVSYGIAQMEAQLGVTLFAREGSRRPVLTDEGRGLLAEAKSVADGNGTAQIVALMSPVNVAVANGTGRTVQPSVTSARIMSAVVKRAARTGAVAIWGSSDRT